MPAPTTGVTFRQVRNVSGFSRPMSVGDAFIYNFLTMGVIFPWAYLWGPASFPGGDIEWAIVLTLLAQIPISLAYCCLATVLPVTGGDYVYQSRAFGKWGFVSVMSGFVIWILQWIALSGWLFATLGLAPWLLFVGVSTSNPMLSRWGMAVQSPLGIFSISVLLALFTTMFLIRGLRLYVRVQKFLFVFTLVAIAVVIYVFSRAGLTFAQDLNSFMGTLIEQIEMPVSAGLAKDFFTYLQRDVTKSGFNVSPDFSFLATLGIVPVVWTSLQWATYSVEQNTEIAEADSFRKQVVILVISACCVAVGLWLVAHFEHKATTQEFMVAASAAHWLEKGSPETVALVKTVLQPFPNVLAMAVSKNVILATLIALGFIANAFQVTCNCFIGATRILVAMGIDGFLRPLGLESVSPLRHSPVRAHWVYFAASLPWIAAYNFVPGWVTYSLGVTFACGYVFTLSALAATRIPTKMQSSWINSEIYKWNPNFIKVIGWLGFFFGASMVLAYLVFPQLGITGDVPYLIVIGIVLVSYVLYVMSKVKSPLIDKVFEQAPAEVEEFYREP